MRKRSVCQSVFVIVRTICIGIWAQNGDQVQQRNGLGLVWIRSILGTGAKMLAINRVLSANAHAELTYQTTPTAAFKRTL